MKEPSFLVLMNSILLSISSAAFVIIAFFLKDLYQDFKRQMEKTNEMHAELNIHVKLFEELSQIYQQQLEDLNRRIAHLERSYPLWKKQDKKQ